MNTVGEKIEVEKAVCREFNVQEIHSLIARSGLTRAGSWGFRAAVMTVRNKAYRFTVSGYNHSGHVHIVLNGMDLFDIYYCSNRGTIKKVQNDIYGEDLIEVLDIAIERQKEYVK